MKVLENGGDAIWCSDISKCPTIFAKIKSLTHTGKTSTEPLLLSLLCLNYVFVATVALRGFHRSKLITENEGKQPQVPERKNNTTASNEGFIKEESGFVALVCVCV